MANQLRFPEPASEPMDAAPSGEDPILTHPILIAESAALGSVGRRRA
jgi:hypothetical protein